MFTCPSLAVDLEDGPGLPLADEEVPQHGVPCLSLRQLQGLVRAVRVMGPANHSFFYRINESQFVDDVTFRLLSNNICII